MDLEGHEMDKDMMTPKEKAQELVDRFKYYVHGYVGSSMLTNYEYPDQILSQAKKVAHITVDEIISTGSLISDEVMTEPSHLSYWEDVIKELNLIV